MWVAVTDVLLADIAFGWRTTAGFDGFDDRVID